MAFTHIETCFAIVLELMTEACVQGSPGRLRRHGIKQLAEGQLAVPSCLGIVQNYGVESLSSDRLPKESGIESLCHNGGAFVKVGLELTVWVLRRVFEDFDGLSADPSMARVGLLGFGR